MKFELLYLDGSCGASQGGEVDKLIDETITASSEYEALEAFLNKHSNAYPDDAEDYKAEKHPLLAYFDDVDITGGWPILLKYNFGRGVKDGPYTAEESLSAEYGYPNVDEISSQRAKYWGIEDEYANILSSYDEDDEVDEDYDAEITKEDIADAFNLEPNDKAVYIIYNWLDNEGALEDDPDEVLTEDNIADLCDASCDDSERKVVMQALGID